MTHVGIFALYFCGEKKIKKNRWIHRILLTQAVLWLVREFTLAEEWSSAELGKKGSHCDPAAHVQLPTCHPASLSLQNLLRVRSGDDSGIPVFMWELFNQKKVLLSYLPVFRSYPAVSFLIKRDVAACHRNWASLPACSPKDFHIPGCA